MVQLRDVGAAHVGDLPRAERRQDDLVQQPLVLCRRAAFALCLGMLGKKPLGEFGDGRRFLPGRFIGCRIGAALDQAQQALRFAAGLFGRPRGTMLPDRHLAQRCAAPDAGAVMDDVALRAAPLNPAAEALQLRIP